LEKMKATPFKVKPGDDSAPSIEFQQLVKNTGVFNCLECGKCTASCPVARRDPDFSPRRTIEKALEDLVDEIETDRLLWSCLTCKMCEQRCPSGVRYCEFVRGARAEARRIRRVGRLSHSGVALGLMRMQGIDKLKQARLSAINGSLKIKERASGKDDYLYFAGCAPFYQALYSELAVRVGEIPNQAIALLNQVGIQPVVMDNERCCGHDLLWNGDLLNFQRLVEKNLKEIKKAGVRRIVTSCPECYRTLKLDYPRFSKFDFEVLHISEVLVEKMDILRFRANGERVTFQDPCRLGRHLGVYDPPRELLRATGVELVEMEHHRADAICCGVAAWVNCGQCSKSIQVNRLREATATGASKIITPCLKCSIHLTCAQTGELPVPREEVEIEVVDFTRYLAEAAGLVTPSTGGEV
jgi:Fe-S oxidoreductase